MNGPWHYHQAESQHALAWRPGVSAEETRNRLESANFHARMAQTGALLDLAGVQTHLLNHLDEAQYKAPADTVPWRGLLRRTWVPCDHYFREAEARCRLPIGHAEPHEPQESED